MADLQRLSSLATADRADLFRRHPETGSLYRNRLFAVALCQGAALHFVNGTTGINDFDVWSFYRSHPKRPFPYRRVATLDFGDAKFGQTTGYEYFVGRRVDLIGRSVTDIDYSDPIAVLQRYLSSGTTESARRLSEKAVILIWPAPLLGTIVWPVGATHCAKKPPVRT